MKKRVVNIIFLVIYILLIIWFIFKSLEDGEESSSTSEKVVDIISNIVNLEKTDNLRTVVRKLIGHFGYFLLLGITSSLFYLTLSFGKLKYRIIIHYSIGLLLAIFSEFVLEANTNGRTASGLDVIIDYSGFILLSTIIITIYLKKYYNRQFNGIA